MSAVAIRVEGLGKQYKIGGPAEPYGSLRESLARTVTAPLSRLRRARTETKETQGNMLWALRDIAFNVKHGQACGIIGRNGAGKSTLLKILSRITEPTTGRVDLYGRVGSLLEVGTGFHPELTGRENIYLNGTILGMSRGDVRRRFDAIVAFAEVEKFVDTPVKRYSSGMYLRLAFSVAAHLEPDILVVDEVLAVGDMQFQKKCLSKMQDIGREGHTLIFVSHNMAAVSALCNTAIMLHHGRLTEQGTASAVVETYMRQLGLDEPDSLLVREPLSTHRPVRITNWTMGADPQIKGLRSFMLGEPLQLWADYECHSDASGYLLFSFSLQDMLGNVAMVVHNELEGHFIRAAGDGRLSACIQDINLRPGTYLLFLDVLLDAAPVISLSLGHINIVATPFFPNYLSDGFPAVALFRSTWNHGR